MIESGNVLPTAILAPPTRHDVLIISVFYATNDRFISWYSYMALLKIGCGEMTLATMRAQVCTYTVHAMSHEALDEQERGIAVML